MTWPPSEGSIDRPETSEELDQRRVRKRRPFKRLHSATKARCNDVYNLAELTKLYGVEDQTIYNWIKEGLLRVPGTSRILVRGDHLNAFHAARREKAKRPLGPTEFLCLGCHTQREPAHGSVTGADPECPALRFEALCPICGRQMFRAWSKRSAEALHDLGTKRTGEAYGPSQGRSDAAKHQKKMRRIATDCDSVSPSSPTGPEETLLMAECPVHTKGSDHSPLQLGFWPATEDDR